MANELRRRLPHLLPFASPELAAAARCNRRRLAGAAVSNAPNPLPSPNSGRLPDLSLPPSRLVLHNRLLSLLASAPPDLAEAAALIRHSVHSNCRPAPASSDAVLRAFLSAGRLADFFALHRFLLQAGAAPTAATHVLYLRALFAACRPDAAVEHLRLLSRPDAPLPPSPAALRAVAEGLVSAGRVSEAENLRTFGAPDAKLYAILMGAFADAGDGSKVLALHQELKQRIGCDIIYDGSIYGSLMRGYFLSGLESEAMDCYAEALGEGSPVRFGATSYNSVLDALGRNGKLDVACQLFDRMLQEHDPPLRIAVDLGSFNSMVDAYCYARKFDDAVTLFRRISEISMAPNILSYDHLIAHLVKNKLVAVAESLYKEMTDSGVEAGATTFMLLMEGCFLINRVDDGVGYFNRMVELGLRIDDTNYSRIIDELIKLEMVDKAQEFFDQMFEKGIRPSNVSYDLLLKAYVNLGRMNDASIMVKRILLDEKVAFGDEVKEHWEAALRELGREHEIAVLYEDVEKEKADLAAWAAEERERAIALEKEEREKRRAEARAREEANARMNAATIEGILGHRKLWEKEDEKKKENSNNGLNMDLLRRLGLLNKSDNQDENKVKEYTSDGGIGIGRS